MSRCKACGASYRRGKRVLMATDGNLVGAIVCLKCASSALLLLASQPAAICVGCMKPERQPQFCATCTDDRARLFHDQAQARSADVAKLRAALKAYKLAPFDDGTECGRAYADGRIGGLEQALSLLENGR